MKTKVDNSYAFCLLRGSVITDTTNKGQGAHKYAHETWRERCMHSSLRTAAQGSNEEKSI